MTKLIMILVVVIIGFLGLIAKAMQDGVTPESAALGMTVGELEKLHAGQLEKFRADLLLANHSPAMAEALLPILKNQCLQRGFPIKETRETREVCSLLIR